MRTEAVPFPIVRACQASLRVLQATLCKDLDELNFAMALLGSVYLEARAYTSKLKHCVSDAFVCGATMMAASDAGPVELVPRLPVILFAINQYLWGAYKFDSDLKSQILNSFSKAVCEALEKALNRSHRTLSAAYSAHRRRAENADIQVCWCPCVACSDLRCRFHQWLYHQWLLLVFGHTNLYGWCPPELAYRSIAHSSSTATALPLLMRSAQSIAQACTSVVHEEHGCTSSA